MCRPEILHRPSIPLTTTCPDAMVSHPYTRHESRHQPSDVGYKRPICSEPPDHRLPSTRHFPERSMNPKYMPSSYNTFISSQPVPQALPLAPSVSELQEHPGKAIPSPLLSHDRGYVGHPVRTDDGNPQYGPLLRFFMIEKLIYSAVYPIVAVPQRCPAQSILTIRPVL